MKENSNEFKIINKNERIKWLNIVDEKNKKIEQQELEIQRLNEQVSNLVNVTGHYYRERIVLLEKAYELACEVRDDWGGREYSGTEYDNYQDYFIAKAKEELKK